MKLQLITPVKPFYVSQPFGGDPTTYGQFGLKGHNGDDLRAYHGQPVYAAHDGFAFYEVDESQGHGVIVISDRAFDHNGQQCYAKTIYWHFCDPVKEPQYKSPITVDGLSIEINLGNGQPVKAGDLLGYADSTGFSKGDHLHFGLKFGLFDGENGMWRNVDQNNGYLGAVNPIEYIVGIAPTYEQDMAKIGLLQRIVALYQQVLALMKLKK